VDPATIMRRLDEIEVDLAVAQNELEGIALAWFRAKREREVAEAMEFTRAEGPVEARRMQARRIAASIGVEQEARWEAKRAVVRVLESRANVGMALLKSMGRS
jgi:hypothetical protein